MVRLLKGALLFLSLAVCGSAVFVTDQIRRRVPPPAPHELFAVVEKQLAAFRAADYTRAYRYAASGVQQKFTMPQFEAMVRREYGEMAHAQRVEFGFVRVAGAAAVVEVFFVEENGWTRAFLYSLSAEGGTWKIDGVQPMESKPPGCSVPGLHI